MPFQFFYPLGACFGRGHVEFKDPARYHNIESIFTNFDDFAAHVVKIDHTLRHFSTLALKVFQFTVLQHKVSLLPVFEPRGTLFEDKSVQPLRKTHRCHISYAIFNLAHTRQSNIFCWQNLRISLLGYEVKINVKSHGH